MSKDPNKQSVQVGTSPEGLIIPKECPSCGCKELECDANAYLTNGKVGSVTLLPWNLLSCSDCGESIENI